MRQYDYKRIYNSLLSPDIVLQLTSIHEYKGKQDLYIEANSDALAGLVEIAKIQSTEASNAIEGISTSDDRLKKLVQEKTMPKTRNEKEIAGYRDALALVHENYDYLSPKGSIMLQLHRDMFKYSGKSIGGNYKNSDNIISEELPDGTKKVRFKPVPAWETPTSIDSICNAFELALQDEDIDPLLLIPVFILDFLCIHPFNDGNGRMSRLLTLNLLYRSGYLVGKYISLERIISDSKESYYEALQDSSFGWHEGDNDYSPFIRYMLGIIIAAYRELDSRVGFFIGQRVSKVDRVRVIIKQKIGKISKSEIMEECPDISQITVQRALSEMLEKGEITKIGGGRYTYYVWNGDN